MQKIRLTMLLRINKESQNVNIILNVPKWLIIDKVLKNELLGKNPTNVFQDFVEWCRINHHRKDLCAKYLWVDFAFKEELKEKTHNEIYDFIKEKFTFNEWNDLIKFVLHIHYLEEPFINFINSKNISYSYLFNKEAMEEVLTHFETEYTI